MTNRRLKILYWLPRVIGILAILFISVFALDAFNPEKTFWNQLGDFLMHLIPSLILTLILIVAWRREFIGGILFTLIGIGFTPFIYNHNYAMNHSVGMSLLIVLTITFPFILIGVLFLVHHYLKKKSLK
ncbi:hypothetical protein [uncultured Winogradskyella sp.]|uniref:DUF7670 domain-containing protein n=1 Tax=uncultured Winogradskyella sp. TaxID=395353 RepID=UPI0035197C76